MRATIAAVAMLVLGAGLAEAGEHPYAGVWSEAGLDEFEADPEFFGENACYNKFSEQRPDGTFRYYLVDHAKWRDERRIEYVLAQEGTCTIDEAGKNETCVGQVIGERQNEWFIAYQGRDDAGVRATYYENVFYFEKRFNGVPIVRRQCPFDMEGMKSFITGKTVSDCRTRCRAFGRSEAAELREMIEALKARQ